ncbi:ABC transporter permease [Bacteroidia bacterium]|nr:ABC transporter permease [Bacteroidia bacterium]GHV70933.1 ABC transporter permease [Bacteroidia bacterium]
MPNLKKSLRIIFRNKTYSILNILGLTIGITSAALIFLWVEYNFSFNKAIPHSENLYEFGQHQQFGDDTRTFFVAPGPMPEWIKNNIPEVKRVTRCGWGDMQRFVPENSTHIFSEKGEYLDESIFEMIGMTFVRGNVQTAFEPAFPIVISEKMAEKIFGREDPVGKSLQMAGQSFEVTGVYQNLPKNTRFQFEWVIPFRIKAQELLDKGWAREGDWDSNWLSCYVEVEPRADIKAINKKMNQLLSEMKGAEIDNWAFIYQINRMRLYGEFIDGMETGSGYIRTVRLFFMIGLVILLIACINFMNLSTARSQKRALEVGVRKTFGTKRKALIKQFLMESALITAISLVLAVGLVYLCLPSFNELVSRELFIRWSNPVIIGGLLGIGVLCTFLAGSYPAFYLSSFSPMATLKKQKAVGNSSVVWIRKGLVVFQFTAAFILICATLVVFFQIRFVQKRDLGIVKENLVTFNATDDIKSSFSAVRNELLNTGYVESAALSSMTLLNINNNGWGYNWQGKEPEINLLISRVMVSSGLMDAAGLKLIDGVDFTIQDESEGGSANVIINQTLAEIMKEEGKVDGYIQRGNFQMKIIGIVKDFVFNNVYKEKPEPVIFQVYLPQTEHLFVRLKSGVNPLEAIAKIKSTLQTFNSSESFEPTYMDDRFNAMFSGERLEGKLSALFAGLAIFISCLGLFGLSAFSAEQRTKEIGIRKVLGAGIGDILVQLGKSYMYLIGISFVIGLPVAWYITSNYLKDYAYRINLGWEIFAGAVLLVSLVALLTVSFQSLRAAMANPVKSIKTE